LKVLVHFEQDFTIKARVPIRTIEKMSFVFEVTSKEDLLKQFYDLRYIPAYLKKISKDNEIQFGKRTMLWYLPETFQPNF